MKKLYVKLSSYQHPIKASKLYSFLYFSFKFLNRQCFSSCMTSAQPEGRTNSDINDHFVYSFDEQTPDNQLIQITRWENHCPVFTFEIEFSQILGKQFCRKRLEVKPNQYLNLAIGILENHQIELLDRKTNEIAHYYSIDTIEFTRLNKDQANGVATQPSFLCISAGKKQYYIPDGAQSRCLVLQLPDKIMFQYFSNGSLLAASEIFDSQELLKKTVKVGLISRSIRAGFVEFEGRWGYNLSNHNQLNLLSDVSQLSLYDFEVVLDKDEVFLDTKMKVSYGNKVYEMVHDNISGKKLRYRKLLTLIIKPDDQEITFKLEKNHIEFCNVKVFTDQLHQCETVRKKLAEGNSNGKQVGTLRFRSQKAKTLSLPQNNRFWRELIKTKMKYNYILSMQQLSYYYQQPPTQKLKLNVTMGNLKTPIQGVVCLSEYPNHSAMMSNQQPVEFQIRQESAIYITFEREGESDEDNVEGMAVIDFIQLRLGLNALEIPLFKNQKLASHVNLLINKIPNMIIVKPGYQPEIMARLKKKIRNVSVDVKSTFLNSYFYTFEYENKNELYCIVEINRTKKVLLLDRESIDGLSFIQGQGSDYLNFAVQETENLRVKLTFLIADLGAEEEIYGTVIFKCHFSDLLTSGSITFSKTNIKNDYEIVVGNVSVNVNVSDSLNRKSQAAETESPVIQVSKANRRIRAEKSAEAKSIKNLSLDNGSNRYMSIDQKDYQRSQRYYPRNNSIRLTKQKEAPRSLKLPPIPAKGTIKPSLYHQSIRTLIERTKKQDYQPMQIKQTVQENMDDTISKLQKQVQINKKKIALNRAQNKQKAAPQSTPQPMILTPRPMILREQLSLKSPNLVRNFQLLFPNKFNKMKKTQLRQQIELYQEKLKGLKSVLNDIDKDIPELEAEVHEQQKPKPVVPLDSVEFQDNEFMGADQQTPAIENNNEVVS